MHLDFPSSPTNGQKYPASPVAGIPTYVWDSEKWTTVAGSVSGKTAIVSDGSVPMVAQLTLVTPPVAATDAASKGYVDAKPVPDVTKSYVDTQDALRVLKAGDTMTGNLGVTTASWPSVVLSKTGSGTGCTFIGQTAGKTRWDMRLGDHVAESGGNAGSDFSLTRYDDAGNAISGALSISRANGSVAMAQNLTVGGYITGAGCPIGWPIATRVVSNINMGLFNDSGNGTIGCINDAGNTWQPLKLNASVITTNCAMVVNGSVITSAAQSFGIGPGVAAGLTTDGNTVYLMTASNNGWIYFSNRSITSQFGYINASGFTSNGFLTSNGNQCKSGTSGGLGSNYSNLFYNTGNGHTQLWIDGAYQGDVAYQSDYRIKKDVIDLPGMWDTVKNLRPIKYTQADFTPPSQLEYLARQQAKSREVEDTVVPEIPMFKSNDEERWGFIAHELQETLVPSAATGEKDSYDTVQSPNPWTVISALTKALQEAMARIEALEATG